MGLERDGGWMIGHQEDAIIVASRHAFDHRADDFLVEVFQRLNLFLNVTHVAGFVDGFDMNENQIVLLERAHTVLTFTDIVSIEETGDTRHIDALESRIDAEAMNNVDGRDHPAGDAETLGDRRQLRRPTLPPKPNRGRLTLALRLALPVDGMVSQYRS